MRVSAALALLVWGIATGVGDLGRVGSLLTAADGYAVNCAVSGVMIITIHSAIHVWPVNRPGNCKNVQIAGIPTQNLGLTVRQHRELGLQYILRARGQAPMLRYSASLSIHCTPSTESPWCD